MSAKILIVDDEPGIRALIQGILEDEGYRCLQAANSQEAYAHVEKNKPDLIVLDIWLQESSDDGIKILSKIKEDNIYLPVIMISGHGTVETAVQSIKLGAYDFIEKPFKSDRLLLMIRRALEAAVLKRENHLLKNENKDRAESKKAEEETKSKETIVYPLGNTDLMQYSLKEARDLFELEYLNLQIKRFEGNISKTAEFVGMERSALHRKLKTLSLVRKEGDDADPSEEPSGNRLKA